MGGKRTKFANRWNEASLAVLVVPLLDIGEQLDTVFAVGLRLLPVVGLTGLPRLEGFVQSAGAVVPDEVILRAMREIWQKNEC